MKRLSIVALAILQVMLFTACKTAVSDSGKLQVYTSFYAMYDFARQIGGDKADIYLICPVSQEPHDFEPTAQDIAKLSQADVFVYNGMGMEHWTDSIAETLPNNIEIVKASSFVTGSSDPHKWLNPDNAYKQIKAINDAFKKKDPDNAEYYDKRLSECKEKIKLLNQDLKTVSGMFTRHSVVVSHDAYSDLCNLLNITQISINGTNNNEEPTPQRMAEIEDYIKENGIKYIFTEPMGTSDIVKAIAHDTGCEILVLDPFEGNTENKDYFKVMYENIAELTHALN